MPSPLWRRLALALAPALLCLAACGDGGRPAEGASAGEKARPGGDMHEAPRADDFMITFEEVADLPYPGTVLPGAIAFSPDDGHLTYLDSPERSLVRELYALSLADADAAPTRVIAPPGGGVTEENLSTEEKLRRERQRVRGLGITSYAWSRLGERILVPSTGDIYVQDGLAGPLRLVLDTEGAPALDPRFSPDGDQVAYVQDDELWVVPSAGGSARQLTTGAHGTGRTHGLAEYVAQEEMDRSQGYWWSPDSRSLAFTEVDETHIPVYRIVHQGKDAVGDEAQEDHRYPFAGGANAKVRLAVVAAAGGEPRWMDLSGQGDDFYVARVNWAHDGSLTAQVEDRAQSQLTLRALPQRARASGSRSMKRGDTVIRNSWIASATSAKSRPPSSLS